MKILGGRLKGRNFYMPVEIRPTQNLLRQAVFDVIGHDLTDLTFLDLFAGSGAMGLDAISRNAQKVVMVERDFKNAELIRKNLELLEINWSVEGHYIVQGDVFASIKQLAYEQRRFDVVFADPPYRGDLAKKTLKTLGSYDILQPSSLIIIQCDQTESKGLPPDLDGRFLIVRQKIYGASVLTVYGPKDSGEETE